MAGAKGLTAAAKLLTAGAVVAGIGGAAVLLLTPGSVPDAPPEASAPDAPPDTAQASLDAPEARVGSDAAARLETAPEASVDASDDPAAEAPAAPELPEFDLVRVSPDGSALVAGRAAPGMDVAVTIEGAPAARTVADGQGSFVAMFALAPSDQPRAMELQAQDAGGTRLAARDTVIVSPRQVRAETGAPAASEALAEPAPPGLFVASEDGIRVMRDTGPGAAPQVMDDIVVDAISYGAEGDVALAGRGAGSDPATVRIYIDDREISAAPMAPDGNWRAELPDIDPGVYTLRIDQIDAAGAVESRFETPFQRESPEQIARLRPDGHARSGVVTVQPGYTLWGISRSHYGRGILYVQVFEENREQIRDPDLIYPGQVFDIPEIARDEIEALP